MLQYSYILHCEEALCRKLGPLGVKRLPSYRKKLTLISSLWLYANGGSFFNSVRTFCSIADYLHFSCKKKTNKLDVGLRHSKRGCGLSESRTMNSLLPHNINLKGRCHKIFDLRVSLSKFPPGLLINHLKYLMFWFRFRGNICERK
jgi:hypothetical protein